jgi:hypothetical protein
MRKAFLIFGLAAAVAGCSFEIPEFVGREGTGQSLYVLGGNDPLPDPVPLPLRSATLEPALHGVIVRVQAVAPSQGYYSALLVPLSGGRPDASGVVSFQLAALPPTVPGQVGPERTRLLDAAVFVPNGALKGVRGFRVGGAGTAQTLPLR